MLIDKKLLLQQLDLRSFYMSFIPSLKVSGKADAVGLCPFHRDHNKPNLNVNLEKGVYHCFACGAGGDIFTFYMELKGVDFPTALKEIAGMNDIRDSAIKPRFVAAYDYADEAGLLLFQVVRFDPKDFKQRRPDGNGDYIWNMDGVRRVLYHLSEVLKAEIVYVVEGEKDADHLRALGLTATCNPGGANKWKPEFSESLRGKRVIIIPDNDEPGRRHAEQVAQALQGIAASVKIIEVPSC